MRISDWSSDVCSSDLVIGNFLLDDNGGVLAAGASRQRQMTVKLPAGNAGVGRISVTVTNDVANAVAEENDSATAETNNSAALEVDTIFAPFIQLTGSAVAPEHPEGWETGDTLTQTLTTHH